jgi:dTMP kinase
MGRGRFIVLEGLEGAGKSTAMSTIQRVLQSRVNLVTTREPGGTELGESVRKILKNTQHMVSIEPKSELLLFYAARVQLLHEVIQPALAQGTWVLADRFELSTLAYQGAGRGLDMGFIHQLSDYCLSGFQPDLLIFLDLPPEIGLSRILKRGEKDRIELESAVFFERVYAGYHTEIKRFPHVQIVDATCPLEEVQKKLEQILDTYLSAHV